MRISSILFLLIATQAVAQYDIGLSFGVAKPYFRDIDLVNLERQWNAAMFYRERVASHTDIAVELQLTNRMLHGSWGNGGSLHVEATEILLQHLYISTLLDVRMGESGDVVLRFGPQLGVKLSETFTGTVRDLEQVGPSAMMEDLQRTRTDHFRHDHRLLVGMGFRVPFGSRLALMIDPYFSAGLSRTMKGTDPGRSNEAGVRVGVGRRFYNRSLGQRIFAGRQRAVEEGSSPE